MNLSTADVVAILIAVFAAVISLLGLVVNVINSIKSDAISMDANKTAQRALDIAMFGHKVDLLPKLFGYTSQNASWFYIMNSSHGKATIDKVLPMDNITFKLVGANQFPVVLTLNKPCVFEIEYGIRTATGLHLPSGSIRHLTVRVYYQNEIGTLYTVGLNFDNRTGKYIGEPMEIEHY